MFFLQHNKGFTLIELLVVVSVIGLMSSVVLASVTSARMRAENSAVKANLANAQDQAALFYEANGNSYGITPNQTDDGVTKNVCWQGSLAGGTTPGIYKFLEAARDATHFGMQIQTNLVPPFNSPDAYRTVACNINIDSWIAVAPLADSTQAVPHMWCVDSTGTRKELIGITGGPYWQYTCSYY